MVEQVDAVWLGDASGFGEDHFDLVAPGLRKGLPTFCDKPIGGSVAGTRKILEFAREHKAPLMSSSLFRHEWGMEAALRMRDAGEFGPIQYVIASMAGRLSPGRLVHLRPAPGLDGDDAVRPRRRGGQHVRPRGRPAHALVTYSDRMPAEVWYGRPDESFEYCHTAVHFKKKPYEYTPSIEGDFWYGHHYEMFRMAATFREMVRTRRSRSRTARSSR